MFGVLGSSAVIQCANSAITRNPPAPACASCWRTRWFGHGSAPARLLPSAELRAMKEQLPASISSRNLSLDVAVKLGHVGSASQNQVHIKLKPPEVALGTKII